MLLEELEPQAKAHPGWVESLDLWPQSCMAELMIGFPRRRSANGSGGGGSLTDKILILIHIHTYSKDKSERKGTLVAQAAG